MTDWPVLRSYSGERLREIRMPLGGIGTGTVSLGGRGNLTDWEVGNRPAKGFVPRHAFFALWTRRPGRNPATRVLEGPVDPSRYSGQTGSPVHEAGLPRFASARFDAAYPLAAVTLEDPEVPLDVRLEAFNPLLPCDVDSSGVPVAVLRYVLTNPTDEPVEAAVCGSLAWGTVQERPGGLLFEVDGDDPGTLALAVESPGTVTRRTSWPAPGWGQDLLDFWDDFSADGALDARGTGKPVGSLATRFTVAPGASVPVTYLLGWHFPNRRAWTARPNGAPQGYLDDIVGNHYTTVHHDAWDVVERTLPRLSELEARTVEFVDAFCSSDLPLPVREAALFNLSTLRSQTVFRTPDGRFFGWEGCMDTEGSCYGSCTHVWNYEQATAFLFGEIARSMREVEFAHATDERGLMSFRIGLPLAERAGSWGLAAADGQFGALVKLYRVWKLSGDDDFLRALWPKARKALEFAWIEGGWDADRDGVPEGCQHNTMDVEYYGPNPQMAGWYLAALKAVAEMARQLGEDGFADECAELVERGAAWVDAKLFNGSYYRHEIRPATTPVADGLRWDFGGDPADPTFQLGDGCLVDQLVGQYAAHVAGLGHVLDPAHVRTTLRHIATANRRDPSVANPMRAFALGDEPALVMCSYQPGTRPDSPFPYFAEVMTGFEYTAAVGMLYEGLVEEGLRVISDIRSRYDGLRRNPFDEAECGHHYARAMAGWSAVLALTGFDYDGRDGTITFAASDTPLTWFWSTGDAWGTVHQSHGACSLKVLGGRLALRRVVFTGRGDHELPGAPVRSGGFRWRTP